MNLTTKYAEKRGYRKFFGAGLVLILVSLIWWQSAWSAYVLWQSDLQYRKGNMVRYDGSVYRATANSKGVQPGGGAAWERVTAGTSTTSYGATSQEGVAPSFGRPAVPSVPSSVGPLSAPTSPKPEDSATQGGLQIDAANRAVNVPAVSAPPLGTLVPVDAMSQNVISVPQFSATLEGDVNAAGLVWAATREYALGVLVSFRGKTWRAQRTNVGEQPGTTAAWKPIGVSPWLSAVRYAVSDVVLFNDIQWIALAPSQGREPSVDSEVWGVAATTIDWNPSVIYKQGAVAYRQNIPWKALRETKNEEPGLTSAWKPTITTSWYAAVLYANGDKVRYGNLLWIAAIQNEGKTPSTTAAEWAQVGAETPSEAISEQMTSWVADSAFVTGARVLFDGVSWVAQYWSRGEVPGTTAAWKPAVTTKWYAGVAYVAGDQVMDANQTWQARGWTQAIRPSTDSSGTWVPVQ